MWTFAPVIADGGRPSTADLAAVNDSVGPQPVLGLDPDSGRRTWLGPVTGEQVLAAAAREIVDLLGTGFADRVCECEASDCRLLFVDTSRPGKRRWCSMKRCGNWHKVQAYRARKHD